MNRFDFVNLTLLPYLLVGNELNHITETCVAELSCEGVTPVSSFVLRLNLNVRSLLLLVQGKWMPASAPAHGVLPTCQRREGTASQRISSARPSWNSLSYDTHVQSKPHV